MVVYVPLKGQLWAACHGLGMSLECVPHLFTLYFTLYLMIYLQAVHFKARDVCDFHCVVDIAHIALLISNSILVIPIRSFLI